MGNDCEEACQRNRSMKMRCFAEPPQSVNNTSIGTLTNRCINCATTSWLSRAKSNIVVLQVKQTTVQQMPQATEKLQKLSDNPALPASSIPATCLRAAHGLRRSLRVTAVLKYFRKPIAVDNKQSEGFDPVTAADRAAEKVIAKALQRPLSRSRADGEEFGMVDGVEPRTGGSSTRSTARAPSS